MDGLGLERNEISPRTLLATVIPREERRQNWLRLKAATKMEIPDLEHPAWVVLSLAILTLFLSLALVPVMYVVTHRFGASHDSLLLAPVIALILVVALSIRLSRPLATAFPNGAVTVGDLAEDALTRNHARLASAAKGWSESEVWETLCRLIVNQLGVDREKVKPDARIVQDLGVD